MIIKCKDIKDNNIRNFILKQVENLIESRKGGTFDDLKVFEIGFTIKEVKGDEVK